MDAVTAAFIDIFILTQQEATAIYIIIYVFKLNNMLKIKNKKARIIKKK
jgi:hypothetical protein